MIAKKKRVWPATIIILSIYDFLEYKYVYWMPYSDCLAIFTYKLSCF